MLKQTVTTVAAATFLTVALVAQTEPAPSPARPAAAARTERRASRRRRASSQRRAPRPEPGQP